MPQSLCAIKLNRRSCDQVFLVIFLSVLCLLILSVVQQIRLAYHSTGAQQSMDEHNHHTKSYIFSRMNEEITVRTKGSDLSETDRMCTLWNCIDTYRCIENTNGKISVYIYDVTMYVDESGIPMIRTMSKEFLELLWAVVHSPYYTSNPEDACFLIPPVDLLNSEHFNSSLVANILASLTHWDKDGRNHLLFNMLPGKAPAYHTTLDFPIGNAIILGSGFSDVSYRRTFDVAIPQYNPHQLSDDFSQRNSSNRPILILSSQLALHQDLLTILSGLSKENEDVVVLRRCEGSKFISSRCDTINNKKYDYPNVLTDATFCIVGRSHRLTSTLLHDILRGGCIPVIIMPEYVMPFSEVLDWKRAAVFFHEDNIHELLSTLTSLSEDHGAVAAMRSQVRLFHDRYFSSMAAIARTSLDILNDRLLPHRAKQYTDWNGPLVAGLPPNPFFVPLLPSAKQGFTAVILTYNRPDSMAQLVRNLIGVRGLTKIIIVWNDPVTAPPSNLKIPSADIPIKLIRAKHNRLSNRFYPYKEIETDCVLSIDDDILMVTPEELNFGYQTWLEMPDRLVGFPPRLHFYNNSQWLYDSEWQSDISMVLTGAAFYHKYYHFLYTSSLPGDIKQWVDVNMNCEDIAMNFLISSVTGKAPVKLLARKKFRSSTSNLSNSIQLHMVARTECMRKFNQDFGMMPLKSVEFRADPLLYKDMSVPESLKEFPAQGVM